MAEGFKVWQICPWCSGTGINRRRNGDGEITEDTCWKCNGIKYLFWGWSSKEDYTLPENLPEP